jgi:spermidine synthase
MTKRTVPPYLGIFLTSLSAIVFEISLTKIFSVTLWYHFAYLVVSLALFGLGAGGLAAFFWQSCFSERFPDVLKHLASFQFLSMILCLLFVVSIPQKYSEVDLSYILGLSATYVICAIPFFLVGLILSLAMRHYTENTPKVYFADLLGSGAGCVVFVFAITIVSGPSVVLIGALLALAASLFFAEPGDKLDFRPRMGIAILLTIGLSYVNVTTEVFSVKYTKVYREQDNLLFEKWSPLARVTIYPGLFRRDNPQNPFGWGMSKKFKPEKPIRQLWIEQDACAGTPITHFTGDVSELEFLKYDITSFAYHMRPQIKSVFIIGSGGGRDVLTALSFGVQTIKACDINPVIVNLVRHRFREFAGNVYELPGVDVEIAEGRSFIRSQDETFDVAQISLIDSWAATVAGAFSLAENNLYTVEAFSDYLDRLNEDGVLSISRGLFKPRNQSLRVAIIAREALEMRGVEGPEQNIAVIATAEGQGVATILVKRTAFTQSEIERIQEEAQDLDFVILYLPGLNGDAEFVKALTARPLQAYLKDTYYDLRPSTDDRPFFFQMMYFSRAFDLILRDDVAGQKFNYYAPLVLIFLIAFSSVLVLISYVLPLTLSLKAGSLPKLWGVYFILLGVGFMFVEIPLLQKGSLYLGHPTLSLSIVLFSMLTFAGCGSYWSQKISGPNLLGAIRACLLMTVLLIGIVTAGSEWLIRQTIGFPLLAKTLLFVPLIGIAAFFMGTAFPSGIRLVSRVHGSSVPWVWALNGGASVMGSVLAMTVAMTSGYMLTLVLGGTCYLAALLVACQQKDERRQLNA